jgi:hypothetical protein
MKHFVMAGLMALTALAGIAVSAPTATAGSCVPNGDVAACYHIVCPEDQPPYCITPSFFQECPAGQGGLAVVICFNQVTCPAGTVGTGITAGTDTFRVCVPVGTPTLISIGQCPGSVIPTSPRIGFFLGYGSPAGTPDPRDTFFCVSAAVGAAPCGPLQVRVGIYNSFHGPNEVICEP